VFHEFSETASRVHRRRRPGPARLSQPASVDDQIRRVVTLLAREMLLAGPGKQTVLDRLLDVLAVLGPDPQRDRPALVPRGQTSLA